MSLLNQLNCISEAGNTGVGVCSLDFKKIVGAFLTPKGYIIPAAAMANSAALLAQLQADASATNKADRIYPIAGFVNAEDGSSGLQKQTFGYGAEAPVRDGINNWTFQFVKGGLSLLSKLRLFNKSTAYDFIFFDDENKLMGTAGVDNAGAAVLKAIPSMYFWAHQWKANTGQAVAEYKIEFAFLPQYVNEYVASAKLAVDIPTNVVGLQDVVLTGLPDSTPASYDVTAIAGGADLGELYPDELADAALWVAKNFATGLSITILGVTYNAEKGFVLALDDESANYPGSGGFVSITLAAPATLAAAGVVGFESAGPAKIAKS